MSFLVVGLHSTPHVLWHTWATTGIYASTAKVGNISLSKQYVVIVPLGGRDVAAFGETKRHLPL